MLNYLKTEAKRLNLQPDFIIRNDSKKRSKALWYGVLSGKISSKPAETELLRIIEAEKLRLRSLLLTS